MGSPTFVKLSFGGYGRIHGQRLDPRILVVGDTPDYVLASLPEPLPGLATARVS